jgi:uncharacterized MAPEG superfamily protein
MVAEFGSTGAAAMLVFQTLKEGNGTNPFRLAFSPRDMPAQLWADAEAVTQRNNSAITPQIESFMFFLSLTPMTARHR